jgi:RND family efflux transporter MFP subunit
LGKIAAMGSGINKMRTAISKNSLWIALLMPAVFLPGVSAAQDNSASPVKLDTVVTMPLFATTDLMGTVQSRAHIKITAGVDGRLEWLAEPGTHVNKGDYLVKMDLVPLQLKLAEQTAQVKRTHINTKHLKNELNRFEALFKTQSISEYQLEQVRTRYELEEAELEISRLKKRQLEDQISRATIRAPFDGVVTERLAREGTDVSRSELLLKLLDTGNLEVCLFAPVKYLPYVSAGDLLNIGEGEQKTKAVVVAVIPNADPKSQTFELRISIPGITDKQWITGELVKVAVPVQPGQPSLTIHRDALVLRKEGTYVVKVDEQNKAYRLPVTVGAGVSNRVSILGALTNGDKVVIRGAEGLIDGQKVIVQ